MRNAPASLFGGAQHATSPTTNYAPHADNADHTDHANTTVKEHDAATHPSTCTCAGHDATHTNPEPGPMTPTIYRCKCGRQWFGARQAHCPRCHHHFSTVRNFDRHQFRTEKGIVCRPGHTVGLQLHQTPRGTVWRERLQAGHHPPRRQDDQ